MRPRGWHLPEKHVRVDGQPASASLFDFALYFFHNARYRVTHDSGVYLYLPKLEHYLEARLWNDVFVRAQDLLGIPQGTIKATVLIEHILAAFQMEEILYELRHHSAGLNCGRWDYLFSYIKKFARNEEFIVPDRAQVTMTVAVHAGLHAVLHQDLPSARHLRHGRHGGLHPGERRRGRQRKGPAKGARGQASRSHRRP